MLSAECFQLTADSDPLHPKISKTPVILSEQSESKDLRTTDALVGQFGAKIPPRATLGRDDIGAEVPYALFQV